MIKVYPNQPVTLKASLDDKEPEKLVELKKLEIINKDGDIIKSLMAEKDNGEWLTTMVFPKKSEPGQYEIKWSFSFNGDEFNKTEYLTLYDKIDVSTTSAPKITQPKNIEESVDDSLPQDVIDLLGGTTDV